MSVPITGDGTPGNPLDVAAATTVSRGTMSAAQVTKLDGIASGATNTPLSSTLPAAIGSAAIGVGTTAARDDHVHALPAVGTAGTYAYPSSITTDAQGRATAVVAGSAPAALSSTLPTAVGTAAIGVGTTAARDDHAHFHGNQAGGTLHATAVAGVSAGFISAVDQAKLDAIPTPTGGTVNLAASDYDVTGSFADIGLNVALPEAGTYRITIDLWTVINAGGPSTGDQIVYLRLYDNTAGTAVANSDRSLGCIDAGGLSASFSSSVTFRVTVASARTIKAQAFIDGSEDAHIKSGGAGFQYTQLNWEKVSN